MTIPTLLPASGTADLGQLGPVIPGGDQVTGPENAAR
jgi:hypothetical protein